MFDFRKAEGNGKTKQKEELIKMFKKELKKVNDAFVIYIFIPIRV